MSGTTTTWNPRPVTRHELLALAASTLALLGGTLIVALLFVALNRLAGITTPPWLGVLMALAGYAQILDLGALLRRLRWTWNDLGFNRLGRRGWHLVWQIPLSLVLTLLLTLVVAGLVPGLTPDDTSAADGQVLSSAVPWQLAFLLVGPFIEEIAFRRLLMAWFDATSASSSPPSSPQSSSASFTSCRPLSCGPESAGCAWRCSPAGIARCGVDTPCTWPITPWPAQESSPRCWWVEPVAARDHAPDFSSSMEYSVRPATRA